MIEISENCGVYDAFEVAAGQFADRPFLRAPASSTKDYAGDAIEYSYSEVRERVSHLIKAYAGCELTAGARVALAFDSRLDVYIHLLALNALGVSMVPLMSHATDDELLHIIKHSDSKLLVVADEFVERFKPVAEQLVGCPLKTVADMPRDDTAVNLPATGRADEAAMLYTSGTTGKPKGCILSNDYFLAIGVWYNGLGGLCAIDKNDRLVTALPPNHMNALCTSFMAMMLCGGCVIQLDRFHPRQWWQTVREEQGSIIHCLGVMTAILLKLPEDDGDDFTGQVRFSFGPGSDPRHQGAFEERFGIPVIEAWAMTESGAGGMTIAHEEPRHVGQRCIGKPASDTEYRIVDEADNDVAAGEPGELLVRAVGADPRRHFFSGYYKDEQATEDGWRGGWWHTGDVVREDSHGSLFFVDRRKNVIRRSGENIAAVDVEAALIRHPSVNNCAVCPVPDEIRGDEVFAFVIAKPETKDELSVKEIFNYCMERLTYFKVPGYIELVDELPLTASQKVSRGEVKKLARASLETGRCTDLRQYKKRTKERIA